MDVVIGIAVIVSSIVLYRLVEGLFPTPPKPAPGPRSDFQVLTDAVSDELERLHSELSSFSSIGNGYSSIVQEISRLNQKFVELYDKTKSENQNRG